MPFTENAKSTPANPKDQISDPDESLANQEPEENKSDANNEKEEAQEPQDSEEEVQNPQDRRKTYLEI